MEEHTETHEAEAVVDLFLRDVFHEHSQADLPETLQTLVETLREQDVNS